MSPATLEVFVTICDLTNEHTETVNNFDNGFCTCGITLEVKDRQYLWEIIDCCESCLMASVKGIPFEPDLNGPRQVLPMPGPGPITVTSFSHHKYAFVMAYGGGIFFMGVITEIIMAPD